MNKTYFFCTVEHQRLNSLNKDFAPMFNFNVDLNNMRQYYNPQQHTVRVTYRLNWSIARAGAGDALRRFLVKSFYKSFHYVTAWKLSVVEVNQYYWIYDFCTKNKLLPNDVTQGFSRARTFQIIAGYEQDKILATSKPKLKSN